jgi:hypothetical protein
VTDTHRRGPGLAKSRGAPLVDMRSMIVARATDARWRDLFESADTVSEGAVRTDGASVVWFGSSSFILPLRAGDGAASRAFLAEIAGRDVHVRLRALRAARREASLRAPAPLGPATCEMRVVAESRGLRIDVDVQAPLIGVSASGMKPGR